jgi:tRNA nucleotidyltransferase (CCA-adding enzyme)
MNTLNNQTNKEIKKFLQDFSQDPNFKFFQKLLKKFSAKGGSASGKKQAEIYLVGGKVRDVLLQRQSYDYDFVVRNVPAKDLENFLSKEGKVGLVGKSFGVFKFLPKKYNLDEQIDIALPRTEHSFNTGGYRDFDIQSDPSLEITKDLERRDFTINALALNLSTGELIDPFKGQKDLADKLIKTVGSPQDRFKEDYTRMLRAIRFSTQLYFKIDPATYKVITQLASKIKTIPAERITEDLNKILMADNAEVGMDILYKSNLLKFIIPELVQGVGVSQNRSHIYSVFTHSLKSIGFAAKRNYSLNVRLAALFHDIAKPMVKKGEGYDSTFYNHDIVGAKITGKILKRMKYPNETIDKVTHLVRHHMFFYSMGEVSDAGIRRLLARLGKENIAEAIQVRICDRLGMGRPKAKPYKLIELEKRLQEVQFDPISSKMLKINGEDIMAILKIKPGPKIGLVLAALLAEVLEDPKLNKATYLKKQIKILNKLSDNQLQELAPNLEKYEQARKREFFSKFKGAE